MFKPLLLSLAALCGLAGCSSESPSKWQLVWEEEFNDPLDTTTWSKIPRGKPEWAQKMSDNPLCYDLRDGNLILRAITT